MHVAAERNVRLDVITLLINAGADVDSRDEVSAILISIFTYQNLYCINNLELPIGHLIDKSMIRELAKYLYASYDMIHVL